MASSATKSQLPGFHPAVQAWFDEQFAAPTDVQTRGWHHIAAGRHVVLSAPTGSGKTLAAFLWGLSELFTARPAEEEQRLRLLYISPLRALNYDIERNLRAPLVGIARHADQLGVTIPEIKVGVRTGDTSQTERRSQRRHPPDVFITTPESLYVMLTSGAREMFENVQTVIIDEVHAVASSKRGTHLALSLERLADLVPHEIQRVALSATQRPIERIAAFVGGVGREVECVQSPRDRQYDLQVCSPVEDMTAVGRPVTQTLADLDTPTSNAEGYSIWAALYQELYEQITQARSSIVFTNSRRLAERIALQLNELASAVAAAESQKADADNERDHDGAYDGEPVTIARAHHGSIARETRKQIEEQLKAGELPAIVATSSLELGIDMGAVDQVLHIESPKSVASGIQRIGRAGHSVGAVSRGRIYPKHRTNLLECAAVARGIVHDDIEPVRIPVLALDVLAQQIVAMAVDTDLPVDELYETVTRASPYRDLSREQFENVVGVLSGQYPSDDLSDLRPRVVWDRAANTVRTRPDAARIAMTNAGTIPDRGLYGVFLADGSSRVGELDEEMVHETRLGDVIVLGATSWRVEEISRDRVLVSPAPGVTGKTPFWHGEGAGRSVELGTAIGELVRAVAATGGEAAQELLMRDYLLDRRAAGNLVQLVEEQVEATGDAPTDTTIVIERFRDELGDWRICILSPFGKMVHAPWALAIEATLADKHDLDAQALWSDDGIAIRVPDMDTPISADALILPPDELEDLVVAQLPQHALFASRFREVATRALLLPLGRFDRRSPLWLQRIKAHDVLRVAQRYSTFPMILETYRECMRDVFDLPALRELLTRVERREVRVVEVETRRASPLAASLLFDYTANLLYDGDRPAAERRAQALSLDQGLLRELLGTDDIRELLDADAIEEVQQELQRIAGGRQAKSADALHDLLRELGDLSREELELRYARPDKLEDALAELCKSRRAALVRIAGEERYIAAEDTGRYVTALGMQPPQGTPEAFLQAPANPLTQLAARYARTNTPFTSATLAGRLGIGVHHLEAALGELQAREELLRGGFQPSGTEFEWCDPDVLRRLRRRTLARLRREIEPVDQQALARFLPHWQGTLSPVVGSLSALHEVIVQLEGLEASPSVWERDLLMARLRNYNPSWLEELTRTGQIVWVCRSLTGSGRATVSLLLRDHLPLLAPDPESLPEDDPHVQLVHEALQHQGASFVGDITQVTGLGEAEALQALWQIAAAGRATNDSWQTLRSLESRRPKRQGDRSSGMTRAAYARRHRRARTRHNEPASAEWQGRWSLLPTERAPLPERLQAQAEALLDTYGIVTRQVVQQRGVPGGFSAVYRELSRQEELGLVRRGYFVDGLGGAQFALPEAVDRLRNLRESETAAGDPVILRAADPAQPFGSIIPWPQHDLLPTGGRYSSGYVVLAGGRLIALVSQSTKDVTLLHPDSLAKVALALATMVRCARVDRVTIERINGHPLGSDQLASFSDCGFVLTPRGVQATPATVGAGRTGGATAARTGARGAERGDSGTTRAVRPGDRW